MARPSKIDRLPEAVKSAIGDLRRAGRTIDEILAHIRSMGVGETDVSRTGLGEHVRKLDELGEAMRRDRAMADALVSRFGEEPDDKLFRVNVELMQGLLFRMSVAERQAEEVTLTPQDVMFFTSALKNIASASKTDTDRVERIEKRAAEQARREAADVAEREATEAGLSKDRAAELRRKVLGVRSQSSET